MKVLSKMTKITIEPTELTVGLFDGFIQYLTKRRHPESNPEDEISLLPVTTTGNHKR